MLVVDDNFTFRYFFCSALKAQGYNCVEAEDGTTALEQLETGKFDLVLTDYKLLVKSGSDLLNRLAQNGKKPSWVTILLTGPSSNEVNRVAHLAGASAVWEKGGDLNALLEKVKEAAERHTHRITTILLGEYPWSASLGIDGKSFEE